MSFYIKHNNIVGKVVKSIGLVGFKCHGCRVIPSVAYLWSPLTCNGNTAIFLAAPFKLVIM